MKGIVELKNEGIPRKTVVRLMKSAMPVKRQISDPAVEAVLEYLSVEIQCIMEECELELQRFNGNPNTLKQNKRLNGFILQKVIERRRFLNKAKM